MHVQGLLYLCRYRLIKLRVKF